MPHWGQVLQEITDAGDVGIDSVRKKYLTELHNYTGRNVIAYYSGWQQKPGLEGTQISDEDRNGIMMAVAQCNRDLPLDIILHTPGGNVSATMAILSYIKEKFGRDVRAIVPLMAMSAGTMIAFACRSIIMGKQSSIGPIDPQIRGVAAKAVVKEFNTAHMEIKQDASKAAVWLPILRQYTPTFVTHCQSLIELSEAHAKRLLRENMFADDPECERKVEAVIHALSDYDTVKAHDRQINFREAIDIGLDIVMLEDDQRLQDAVLSIHHCYTILFQNTGVYKIIENPLGLPYMRIQK